MAYKTNETKNRIIATALELIKKSGYDNITINEICKCCDISKHTFYYYFTSKDDILLKFHTIPKEVTLEKLPQILEAKNYVEQFWLFMEPSIDFFDENGVEIAKCIFKANIAREVGTFDVEKKNPDMPNVAVSFLQKAFEAGEIRNTSDSYKLFKIVIGYFMAITFRWATTNGSFDLKKECRQSFEFILDVTPELRKNY